MKKPDAELKKIKEIEITITYKSGYNMHYIYYPPESIKRIWELIKNEVLDA